MSSIIIWLETLKESIYGKWQIGYVSVTKWAPNNCYFDQELHQCSAYEGLEMNTRVTIGIFKIYFIFLFKLIIINYVIFAP